MNIKKGSEVQVKIDKLAYGGRGIGNWEGRKIFVEDVVPGDEVKATLVRIKPNYAEAKLSEIVTASEDRISPRCKHFSTCGGCSWQFLPYEKQCEVKEQEVRDAMERIGGLSPDLVEAIIPCEEPWFYRNKMELSFGRSPDGSVMLGLYPQGYHYEVFNMEECFLETEDLGEIAEAVRDWANAKGLSVCDKKTHEGFLRNLILREGKNTGDRMMILVSSFGDFPERESFVELAKKFGATSVVQLCVEQKEGRATRVEEELLWGSPMLREKLHLENGSILEFEIRPQAFFQTNTRQTEKLYSKVLEAADLSGKETVLDLYCGTGTIGLFCAHKAKQVFGMELNVSAVESARQNASNNQIGNIEFILGPVEKELPVLLEDLSAQGKKVDVLIVDPPRSGLGEKVVEISAGIGAKKIVYVSCNPSTLARDLKWFSELGYSTESVTPIDMFPQTYHVESVAVLSQSKASSRVTNS